MATRRDLGGEPPDSTRLDVAWVDVGGVYDRDDSLKENTNPKCLLKSHNPTAPGQHHHYTGGGGGGNSQRFSGNLKSTAAPIIGLSGKLGGGRRTHHQNPPAMFPKKAKTGGGGRNPKPAVPEDEPSSPKVSCIGKVLSERERARRCPRPPPSEKPPRPPGGCCPGFGFMMRRSRSRKSAVENVDWSPPPPLLAARRRDNKAFETEEAAPAPGLAGVMRFASGRRPADWAAEMEVDDRVARSGPL